MKASLSHRVAGPTLIALAFCTSGAGQLQTYDTRYYVIHSDLDQDAIREAELRLTKMAEMYAERTAAFTGKITTRLPFYLFRNPQDYYAAGGLAGSAGVFTGDKLMAIAGEETSAGTWHVLQHEGFHQFVHAVIGGDIPVWVNEGMAEYFGKARFTGDGMVTGLVPQSRLSRIRKQLENGQFKTMREMMELGYATWAREMDTGNYDQAWSMVHFLGHADGGAYQRRFDGFLRDVSLKGLTWEEAWRRNFDGNIEAFENVWRVYWENLPDHPTRDLYAKVTVATLTSFLARAHRQGQQFRDFESFLDAAEAGRLESHSKDWLPPALLEEALVEARMLDECSLERKGRKPPKVICKLRDGTRITRMVD